MNIEMIEQASNEIAEYSKTEAGLAELRSRLENVTYDVTTVKGLAVAKADRAEVRGLRTGLEAMRKSIKAPALAHCKLIDAEAKRITDELLKLETPIDEVIKLREAELEAERAAREAAEKARVMAITDRIAGIRQYIELAASSRTAARVDDLLTKLSLISLADFAEFSDDAAAAHMDAMKRVAEILTEKTDQEAEQARIKAEQEAQAAALKAEREAFAAEQAKAKAEAYRLAAIATAEAAKQDAKVAAAQAALDAQRAEHEAEVQRATQASLDAADAEAALVAMERQLLADERAEFEASVRAAEQAKLQAEQAEADRIDAQAAHEAEVVAAVDAACDELRQDVSTWYGIVGIKHAEPEPADLAPNQAQAHTDIAPSATKTVSECCAPDGICTDACSKDDARKEAAMWNAITSADDSDAAVMWVAIRAVASEYGWTTEQATTRLAEVQWTI